LQRGPLRKATARSPGTVTVREDRLWPFWNGTESLTFGLRSGFADAGPIFPLFDGGNLRYRFRCSVALSSRRVRAPRTLRDREESAGKALAALRVRNACLSPWEEALRCSRTDFPSLRRGKSKISVPLQRGPLLKASARSPDAPGPGGECWESSGCSQCSERLYFALGRVSSLQLDRFSLSSAGESGDIGAVAARPSSQGDCSRSVL
jgi:hypothetical protein